MSEKIRTISATPFACYRWRQEFGGLKSDQVKRLKDLERENERLRKAVSDLHSREADPGGKRLRKLVSPARRRECIDHAVMTLSVSERFACRVLGRHRSTQRKVPRNRVDYAGLPADIIELATRYNHYAIGAS